MKPTPREPLAVSRVEAAQMLGVSLATLERYIKKNKIPAFRLGRRVLIPRGELEKIIEDGRIRYE